MTVSTTLETRHSSCAPQLDEHERGREDIGNSLLDALIDHKHVMKRHLLGKGKKQVSEEVGARHMLLDLAKEFGRGSTSWGTITSQASW